MNNCDCIEVIVDKTEIENICVCDHHVNVVEHEHGDCLCADVHNNEMVMMKKEDLDGKIVNITYQVINNNVMPTVNNINKTLVEVNKKVNLMPNYAVTCDVNRASDTVAASYRFRQAASGLDVTIDIAKSLVISGGDVEDHDEPFEYNGVVYPPSTYIVLVLADEKNSKLYIDAADLIRNYIGDTTDTIAVSINGSIISADVRDGSITEDKLAFELHEVTEEEMIQILNEIDEEV